MSSQFMKFEILGRLAFMDDVNEDIVNLKIAVNGKIKGEDICSWYRVSAYKHTARYLRQYASKGDMVLVSGRSYQKTYTNRDGQEVTAPQMSANDVVITRKSQNSENSERSSFSGQQQGRGGSWYGNSSGQSQVGGWAAQAEADAYGESKGWGQSGNTSNSRSGGSGGWGQPQQQQQSWQTAGGNGGNQGGNGGDDPIPF